MLKIHEQDLELPAIDGHRGLLHYLSEAVRERLDPALLPIRFLVSETTSASYRCELGVLSGLSGPTRERVGSIFDFVPRGGENARSFNAVLLVPTGIGCSIGGHAGDANPVAGLLASVCDTLVTHPNVVNASDVNELPANGLYVEGSVITRLLMGGCALQPVRANRVLAVIDEHPDPVFTHAAVNSVSAARASFGLNCPAVVRLEPPPRVRSEYAPSGRAMGVVDRLEGLIAVMERYRGEYDALAVSTQVAMPASYPVEYYLAQGDMINPWGGVEALFTHALSTLYDVPSAHSPMYGSLEETVAELRLGILDPRMAAEIISVGFFLCVLKGLQRSPRIVRDVGPGGRPGLLTAADLACLVIPDGCIGLPTLAALEQGIKVIAVRENRNFMRNDLGALPWAPGQFHRVENYWEAAGVMAALKAGLDPASLRRPLPQTQVEGAGSPRPDLTGLDARLPPS
jgi:hypothetical protein